MKFPNDCSEWGVWGWERGEEGIKGEGLCYIHCQDLVIRTRGMRCLKSIYMREFGDSRERIFAKEKSQISDKLCQWRDFEDSMGFFKMKFISSTSHSMCPGECGK